MASSDSSLPPLACFDRVDILAKGSMATIGLIGGAALGGYKDIKLPLDSLTLTTVIFLILTLVSGYGLWLYANYMSNLSNLTNWQYMLHVSLVSFSGICLMCSNVLILALVNPINTLLACFLVVVPLVISMLAYAGIKINGTNHLHRDLAFEAAMKNCCDVTYLTTRAATFMHVTVVFMYYKNPSFRAYQLPPIDISVTFLASTLGFFSMMVTAMPLELLPLTMRSKLLFIFKFIIYSMLLLTATTAMTLGAKSLDGLILLTLMLVLMLIVAYKTMLFLTGQKVNPDSNNEDPENPNRVDPNSNNMNGELDIPSMLTGVMNTCIVVLSTVYAFYTGGENDDVYLRVGVFVLVGIIASCLGWIAFNLNTSMNEQRETKLLIGILLGLMITIIVVFLLKICIDIYDQSNF